MNYGSVYVPLHVLFIFYLSALNLEKSTLILEKIDFNLQKSTLKSEFKVDFPRLK